MIDNKLVAAKGKTVVYELETITISQEWTVPEDIVGKVAIRLFGGGGSGGNNGGGGGGHMAYGEFDLKPGDKYTITIGIGGGLGVESYNAGSSINKVTAYKVIGNRAGAATSFGSLLSANGGGGGSSSGGSGGTGGGGGDSSGGSASYGGVGGKGYKPGGNGINTTGFNNPKIIKGTGLGGSQTDGDSGGGGGYGGTGGDGYSYYGGGGGGYGGTGGVGSAYGDAPTGYACGGGGIQSMGSFTGSTGKYISGWGTPGCVLISYLRKTAGDKERYEI